MELGQSIRSGTKWLLAGSGVGQVLQFGFGVILARLLLPADFGMIVTIQVFTGFASLIASGGMGEALVRAKVADERDFQAIFSIQLMFGLLIYLTFFTIAPYFAEWFHDPLYKDLLRVSALSFVTRPFANIHAIWLRREMRFKDASLIGLATLVFTSCLSVVMALAGMGVWTLVLSGLFGTAVNIALLSRYSKMHPRLVFDKKIVQTHGSYGLKSLANDIVNYFRGQISNLLISRTAGPTMVGIYNKAESLGKMPLSVFSGPVYETVFRGMSMVQDDKDKTKYMFLRTVTLLTVYTLPFYLGASLFAEPLILFVYGQKWVASAPVLEIIALAGILFCVGHPSGAVLAAQNQLGRELIAQSIGMAVLIVALIVGMRWGLTGVAVAFVLGHLYTTGHMYWLVRRCLNVSPAEVFIAMRPGLILNAILLASLICMMLLLPEGLMQSHPAYFLAVTIPFAGIVYGAAFLFLPLPSIASESLRWKQMLRLAH